MGQNIWLIIIALAIAITAGFVISLIIEMKKAVRNMTEILKTTEATLKPVLEELQLTLRSLRSVSDDINDVTTDIKTLSASVKDVGLNIRSVSNLIENVASSTAVKASGLKAGIKTGLMFLLSNFMSKTGGRK
jgi:uncharacterized protein YoxC